MGCEAAAIAVAIVSAKLAGHFRSSPGEYFHGMVVKASIDRISPISLRPTRPTSSLKPLR